MPGTQSLQPLYPQLGHGGLLATTDITPECGNIFNFHIMLKNILVTFMNLKMFHIVILSGCQYIVLGAIKALK